MRDFDDGLVAFLARYSAYAAVPCMWFAYIGDVSPWWGAAAGVSMVFLVGLPARLMRWRRHELAADSIL
jgi:hypothetical protein